MTIDNPHDQTGNTVLDRPKITPGTGILQRHATPGKYRVTTKTIINIELGHRLSGRLSPAERQAARQRREAEDRECRERAAKREAERKAEEAAEIAAWKKALGFGCE